MNIKLEVEWSPKEAKRDKSVAKIASTLIPSIPLIKKKVIKEAILKTTSLSIISAKGLLMRSMKPFIMPYIPKKRIYSKLIWGDAKSRLPILEQT